MAIPVSLPGLQVEIEREVIYPVNVQTSMAGIEVRTLWNEYPRYRWRVTVIGRAEATGELAAMDAAVLDVHGETDIFTFTDPYDGASYQCRLASPPRFTQDRIPGWWKAVYEVISLV